MSHYLETREGHRALARISPEAIEFMRSQDGWSVARPSRVGNGMTAHRGVLHRDEYVDRQQLRALVEDRLGFTHQDLDCVFRQGRKSSSQRELRGRIDARLLEIREADGNLTLLAQALGVTARTLDRALARARTVAA